jgi:hypothetical protein
LSSSSASLGLIQFTENFATAFKTRVPVGGTLNVPGQVNYSESDFVYAPATGNVTTTGTTATAGLADFGTRLKATFTNVPSGVQIYVTTRDVTNNFISPTTTTQAVLVVSEGASDGAAPVNATSPPTFASYTPPSAAQTTVFTSPNSQTIGIAPVVTVGNQGMAVWEIINTNPFQIDTVYFGVYINYTASPTTNSPTAPSSMGITLSFAPTPAGGLFTAAAGSAASASLPIPRFSDSLDINKGLGSFALCTTNLLYPYVVNTNGFDTGLAIANTSSDPFGTTPQAGTCTLTFYGSGAPSTPTYTSPSVANGTVWTSLASTLSPGFQGYIFAVCNFQYAHGFAFVSDVGARNLAMGYLALVVPTPRTTLPESLNN